MFERIGKRCKLLILFSVCFIIGCQAKSGCGDIECRIDIYTYKVVDGCEIHANVYRLHSEELRPAILWIHPGGLITGNRDWIPSEQVELYLEAGYTVVSIDHRLAPEYKLETIISDIEDAYAWMRTEGPELFKIDPERIAVVGHSAGGYLALVGGTRLQPQPMALVSFYGYGELTGDWATQPDPFYNERPAVSKDQAEKALGSLGDACIPKNSAMDARFDYYIYARQQGIWSEEVSGHEPEREDEWYATYEPQQNVTAVYPPTMLLHGESDTDIPFEVAVQMVEKLQQQGVEYEWITNPEWGHVFDQEGLDNPTVQDAFGEVLAFLDAHLK